MYYKRRETGATYKYVSRSIRTSDKQWLYTLESVGDGTQLEVPQDRFPGLFKPVS